MNILDGILIVVFAISVIISFFRGFLRELISLLSWVAATWLGLLFMPSLSSWLHQHWFTSLLLCDIVAFVSVFVIVLLIGVLINALVKAVVSKTGLGIFDRLLGVVFGTLRGLVLCIIVIMIAEVSGTKAQSLAKHSVLTPYFQPAVTRMSQLLPERMQQLSNALDRTE